MWVLEATSSLAFVKANLFSSHPYCNSGGKQEKGRGKGNVSECNHNLRVVSFFYLTWCGVNSTSEFMGKSRSTHSARGMPLKYASNTCRAK